MCINLAIISFEILHFRGMMFNLKKIGEYRSYIQDELFAVSIILIK